MDLPDRRRRETPLRRPRDGREMKHLLPAAEKGDADAQFNVAVLLHSRMDENGYPAPGNRAEAIKWLRLAAQQGLARAQLKLAEIYVEGPDAPHHYIKASSWFLLAIGSSKGAHRQAAQSGYDRITALMTPAQIAKAKGLAAAWKPRRPKPAEAAAA